MCVLVLSTQTNPTGPCAHCFILGEKIAPIFSLSLKGKQHDAKGATGIHKGTQHSTMWVTGILKTKVSEVCT